MKRQNPKVRGRRITPSTVQTPIRRESAFLLTINTNYKPTSDKTVAELGNYLSDGVDQMFKGYDDNLKENVAKIIKFVGARSNDKYEDDVIKDVEYEFSVEQGGKAKGGRVHAHVLVKIYHTSVIQIDTEGVRVFITNYLWDNAKKFPIENVHVNVRFIAGIDEVTHYISKAPV
jgi:hypothetical protein